IAESPVAIIVIEDVSRALVHAGRTTRARAADVAIARTVGFQKDVPANVKIQAAVSVVIKKCCAGMKERPELQARHAGFFRGIRERAVSVVVVQNVAETARSRMPRKKPAWRAWSSGRSFI